MNHVKLTAGFDRPDVQLTWTLSPIWYFARPPLIFGSVSGRTADIGREIRRGRKKTSETENIIKRNENSIIILTVVAKDLSVQLLSVLPRRAICFACAAMKSFNFTLPALFMFADDLYTQRDRMAGKWDGIGNERRGKSHLTLPSAFVSLVRRTLRFNKQYLPAMFLLCSSPVFPVFFSLSLLTTDIKWIFYFYFTKDLCHQATTDCW